MVSYYFFLILSFSMNLNPFNLTLILILSSMVVSFSAMNVFHKWLGLSLMLFYLGGMMVLFIYLVSLLVLEKVMFSSLMMPLVLLLFLIGSLVWSSPTMMMKEVPGISSVYLISQYLIPLVTLVLLLSLLMVVNLTQSFSGPLKSYSYA